LDEDLREIESRFHIQPSAIDGDPELEHIVMQSLSSAVGWLYVLEGSTLGGMMISRRIRDTLGVPTHYYVSDVSLTMPKWRAFGAWVNAQANEPWFVLAEACTAAVTAFEIVYGLMERNVTGTARPIN
jgi:heme oxygenase